MKFKKFIASIVSSLMILTLMPTPNVQAALNAVEIATGANYDAGPIVLTYSIESSSGTGYFATISRVSTNTNVNSTFGYGLTQFLSRFSSPYTISRSVFDSGVYRINATISGLSTQMDPDYFAIFPSGSDFFIDENLSNSYMNSGLEFGFAAASKNSTSFNYCLTSNVDGNGEPTDTCVKAGTFNFGERVLVGDGGEDWSDLTEGEYVLAMQDGNGAWASDYREFEVFEPMDVSINATQFVANEPMDLEVTFEGLTGPYNLAFENVTDGFGTTSVFGTFEDITSPVTIDASVEKGVYGVKVTTPNLFLYSPSFVDLTDSDYYHFGVYDEGEDLLLATNADESTFIEGQISFNFTGASKNSDTVTYCVTDEIDGREAVGTCLSDGTIEFGEYTPAFLSSLEEGTYYLTLTDGVAWAEPLEITVVAPLSFTTTGGEDFETGSPLGVTIDPAGGIGPYNVSLHRYAGFNYSSTGTTIATGLAGTSELTYAPTASGKYGFRISDTFGLSSPFGFRSSGDFSSFTVFAPDETIFIEYDPGSQTTILVGTSFVSSNINAVLKTGSEYFFCIAADEFIDDVTGEVLDEEECLASGTSTGQTFPGWTPPNEPATIQIAAQNLTDNNWATPVDIPVAYFMAGVNGSFNEIIELDAGTEIEVAGNAGCSNGCSYYVHTDDTVSDSNFTYSQTFVFGSNGVFDTTEWTPGTYYVKAYLINNQNLSVNDLELRLRNPESNEFLLEELETGETVTARPFQSRTVLVPEVAVEANLGKVVWGQAAEATASNTWDRTVTVTGTKELLEMTPSIQALLRTNGLASKVSVDTGLNESVLLSDEVVVAIPVEGGFNALVDGIVLITDGAGLTTEVEACGEMFTGVTTSEASLISQNNYNVPENSACYVVGTEDQSEYVYIATRHLSDFVVGQEVEEEEPGEEEEPEEEPGEEEPENNAGGGSGSSSGSKVRSLNILTNKALDAPRTLVNYFDDLGKSPAKNAINALKDMGIVQGIDGKFVPHEAITRSEFTKILTSLMEVQLDNTDTGNAFEDVAPTDWHYKYVKAAKQNGVVTPGTNFRPNDRINLAEGATMLYRLLKDKMPETTTEFMAPPTLDKNSWYFDALVFVNKNRLVNQFQPDTLISRAEAALLLYNTFAK